MPADGEPVGFVGLGAIGRPIAQRLLDAGTHLAVFDRDPRRAAGLRGGEVTVCGSPAAVGDLCETVMASLPTPEVVALVAGGPDGVVASRKARIFVDLSTTGRIAARTVGEALAAGDIEYVDAPVSGGVAGAERGSLGVFLSGTESACATVRPLLEPFASNVVRVGGEPGHGQIAKLINNLLSGAALLITAEGVALGVRNGLDPDALIDALNGGSGRNNATEVKMRSQVLNRRFAGGFRMQLMLKDLDLCLGEARAVKMPMPLATLVREIWQVGAAEADEGADQTEIVKTIERWAGARLESRPGPPTGG